MSRLYERPFRPTAIFAFAPARVWHPPFATVLYYQARPRYRYYGSIACAPRPPWGTHWRGRGGAAAQI